MSLVPMASCKLAYWRSGRAFCSAWTRSRMCRKSASRLMALRLNSTTNSREVGGVIKSADNPMGRMTKKMNFQNRFRFMGSKASSGFAGFAAALGDFGNGGFGDFEFRIRRADREGFLFDADDHADDAAGGDDSIAGPDGLEQLGVFFGLLLLRSDEDEVENDEEQAEHRELRPKRRTLLPRLGR